MIARFHFPFAGQVGRERGKRKCYLARPFPVFLCMSSSSRSAPKPDDDKVDHTPAAPAFADAADQGTRAPHPLVARLVEYRQAKGWTQEEAAERLQIPLNTLRGYECGNRNPGGANTEKILTLVGLPKRRSR